jgi:hypothetical protein
MFCTVKESAAFNLASSVSKSSVFCQIETPRRRARRGLRGEGKVIGYLWWVIVKMEESTSSTVAVVSNHHAPVLSIFPDPKVHFPAHVPRFWFGSSSMAA